MNLKFNENFQGLEKKKLMKTHESLLSLTRDVLWLKELQPCIKIFFRKTFKVSWCYVLSCGNCNKFLSFFFFCKSTNQKKYYETVASRGIFHRWCRKVIRVAGALFPDNRVASAAVASAGVASVAVASARVAFARVASAGVAFAWVASARVAFAWVASARVISARVASAWDASIMFSFVFFFFCWQ